MVIWKDHDLHFMLSFSQASPVGSIFTSNLLVEDDSTSFAGFTHPNALPSFLYVQADNPSDGHLPALGKLNEGQHDNTVSQSPVQFSDLPLSAVSTPLQLIYRNSTLCSSNVCMPLPHMAPRPSSDADVSSQTSGHDDC